MNNIFIRFKAIWFTFSISLIALGIVFMVINASKNGSPFNLGIDFTGGTTVLLNVDSATEEFAKNKDVSAPTRAAIRASIQQVLEAHGYTHLEFTSVEQKYFLVRMTVIPKETLDIILDELKEKIGNFTVLESDYIGPTMGYELQKQAITISLVALFLLLIYITFRFEFWAAVAAIIALIHDMLITLGLTSILHIEVNAAYVAAILTILGYSINDTIVIFDRIRENVKHMKKPFGLIAEKSIHQTLHRSVNTVATVLIVLGAIHVFGGASLKDFSLVLLIGVSFGCYSSIFIASPLLVIFKKISD